MAWQAADKLFMWVLVGLAFALLALVIYLVGIPAREIGALAGIVPPNGNLHADRFIWGLFFFTVAALVASVLLHWYENAKESVRQERMLQE